MASGRSRRFAAFALAGTALLATTAGRDARAQESKPHPPEATVPVPPPLPPERPAELKPATAPGATMTDPPRPPERPAALTAPATPPATPETKPAAPPADPAAVAPPAPRPPERPADLVPTSSSGAPPVPAEAKPGDKAADKPGEMPVPPPLPPERPAELSGEAALALKVAAPDDTACRVRLKRLGAAFEPLPAIVNGQCGTPLPLKVTGLPDVALPQSATLTCAAAEALARWATEAQVAAERELKQPLTGIAIGTSYECRGQNHDVEAKLSEHAFANGVDVMSFTFAGRPPIAVGAMPEGSAEGRFLDAVRARACGFFRTVLGPGSNAAHANHLHLDERERNAGHRLCQ
ncbi:extensin family protein [Methylobacterium sp. E-041]|uniref:extensin family protein n=1 Tax=Methylobacterium sp. E-041 TaxID=2836573 RepID=UPI0028BE86FF|nr:extensin family protein [Methylobacterium sp. E-041]